MASFDCFLSHNSQDKPAVRALKRLLEDAGLRCWLDEEQLRPGLPWQDLLEQGIKGADSVAVCVAADRVGPWEDEEQQAALWLAVRDGRPVIPVVLPGAPTLPELPLFLSNRTWVTCASSSTARASRVWSGASPAARPHQGLAPPRRLLRWLNWLNLLRADGPAGQERLVWRCPAVVRAGLRVLS